jgi:hypothetical protein
MRSSNNDITAPISRTRRRKASSTVKYASILMTICIVSVFFFLARAAFSSSGDSGRDKTGEFNSVKSIIRNDEIKSLRLAQVTKEESTDEQYQGLLIYTNLGTIKIYFTLELSGPTSIEYIQKVVSEATKNNDKAATCDRCTFYRAEPDLLLQGAISQQSVTSKVTLGPCPIVDWKPTTPCPAHDLNCGCHGPVMTRGRFTMLELFMFSFQDTQFVLC